MAFPKAYKPSGTARVTRQKRLTRSQKSLRLLYSEATLEHTNSVQLQALVE
jgi:hypothetical protein